MVLIGNQFVAWPENRNVQWLNRLRKVGLCQMEMKPNSRLFAVGSLGLQQGICEG